MIFGAEVVLQTGNDTTDLGRGTRKVRKRTQKQKDRTSNSNGAGAAEERASVCKKPLGVYRVPNNLCENGSVCKISL